MKQDLDLLRAILILTEDQPAGEPVRDFSSLKADQQVIVEHVWLAEQKGLLVATFIGGTPSHGGAIIQRLTPRGHDFLAQAKQPALWNKAKEAIAKAGVGATVEVMSAVLARLAAVAVNVL